MADKKTTKPKTDVVEPTTPPDDIVPSTSPGVEIPHDDHSGFHNYSGGVIIERGDRAIPWYYYAVVVTVLVIVIGFLAGHYNRPPDEVSDATVAKLSVDMANQASPASMTSPYMIDMNELPRPGGQNLDQAISAGSDVYQSYCIGCHGPNQDGAGPNAVSLNPSPRNLRDQPFIQGLSYQRAWTSIHKGVPGTAMPRWENTLTDDQIRDAICYVFSLTAPKDSSGQFIKPNKGDLNSELTSPSLTQ